MPLVLDATVGGVSANAHLTVAAAQTILDGVPNVSAWTSASAATQAQAVVYATTMLNVIAYQGLKFTVAQALSWPRGGVLDPDYGQSTGAIAGYMVGEGNWGVYLDYTLIPKRVQRATAMLALEILRAGTADVWNVDSSANVAQKSVDVLHTTFIDPARRRYGVQIYRNVWREIQPLTMSAVSREVRRA